MNRILADWLEGPRLVAGKNVIVRPSIISAEWDAAVQHAFGSLSFQLQWETEAVRRQWVETLRRWDGDAELCLFISPFARRLKGGNPNGPYYEVNERIDWLTVTAELDRIRDNLQSWWNGASDVVGSLDSEHITVVYDFERYNRSSLYGARMCDTLYPALELIAQDVLGDDVAVEWYDYGGSRISKAKNGWSSNRRHERDWPNEKKLSVPLFTIGDYHRSRQQVYRTLNRLEYGDAYSFINPSVTPWIGVRTGYAPTDYNPDVEKLTHYEYPLAAMARLGLEIANPKTCRYCDWSRVRRVLLWTASGTSAGILNPEDDLDGDGMLDNIEACLPYFEAFRRGCLGEWEAQQVGGISQ